MSKWKKAPQLKPLLPIKGTDYFTLEEIKDFKNSITPVFGEDYQDGYTPIKNKDYFDGVDGKDGEMGDTPKHEIKDSRIRFEQPDGTWGEWISLETRGGMFRGGIGSKITENNGLLISSATKGYNFLTGLDAIDKPDMGGIMNVSINTDELVPIINPLLDHGLLLGLADDDHTQYHTDARGDARYLQILNNLSDLNDVPTARVNLGLVSGGTGDIWMKRAGDLATGDQVMSDDVALGFGNTQAAPDAKMYWNTAPATDNLLLALPNRNNVGFVVGTSLAIGNALAFLEANGDPYIAALDDQSVMAITMSANGNDGRIATSFGDLILSPSTGRVSIPGPGVTAFSTLAPLHVGNQAINKSDDCVVLVSRTVDDTVSGNGHCYSDSSTIDRAGTIAYNSVDGRFQVEGTHDYDHFALFQDIPSIKTTGTTDIYYGHITAPNVSNGTLNTRYGIDVWDVILSAGGSVGEQIAFHSRSLTAATTNWGVKIDGTTASYFGGLTTFISGINGGLTGSVANLTLQSNPENDGNVNLGASLKIEPDGSAPGSSSFGVIAWPNGSKLYEQNSRFFFLPNGDRWEVLDETGSTFLFGVHGTNSALPNRTISYNGMVVGGSYAATAPPSQGLIVSGVTGIGTASPSSSYRLTVQNSGNLTMALIGNNNFGGIDLRTSGGTRRGIIGYDSGGGYIQNSRADSVVVRGENGVVIGDGFGQLASFTYNSGDTTYRVGLYNEVHLTWGHTTDIADPKADAFYDTDHLMFRTDDSGGTLTEAMKIDSNQRLVTLSGRVEQINTTAKIANYTILASEQNTLCDTSAGAFTVLLPATPTTGEVHTVILDAVAGVLTVSGNGKNINGGATTPMNTVSGMQLIYNGSQWNIK